MIAFFLYAALIIGLSMARLLPTIVKHGEPVAISAHLVIWGLSVGLYWRWSTYRIRSLTEELKPLVERLKAFPNASEEKAGGAERLFDLIELLGNVAAGDLAGLAQFGLEKVLESMQGQSKTTEQKELEQRIASLLQAIDEQRSRFRGGALLMGTVSAVTLLMTLS